MSTYVREKVLRLPIEGFQLEDFKKMITEKLERYYSRRCRRRLLVGNGKSVS